jgi:hypothetical protein
MMAVDLFCGLGGWAEGFLAAGWEVIGFDIERHSYEGEQYPAQLVLQDVLTLTGQQFRKAACIVASPPCQKYSYMHMPWSRAKEMAKWHREDPANIESLNALFNACFRIQREASEAAGRHIPMVVENVKGAQPWVGPAKAHFGSFYLWGDIAQVGSRIVAGQMRFGEALNTCSSSIKQAGLSGPAWFDFGASNLPSHSPRRKAFSARMAKIPFPLANYIARSFK